MQKAAPAKKAPAQKSPAKKTAVQKAAPAEKAPAKKAAVQKAAVQTAPPAKKAVPATAAPVRKSAARTTPSNDGVAVPVGSEWTKSELAEVRGQLVAELDELRSAYDGSMRELDDLQRAGNDGAGDDQADAGSKTFEREQEQSIAANRFELIAQTEHAIERIQAGTYGFCERCGKPIPKARLKAFPAATLDVACKQREERR